MKDYLYQTINVNDVVVTYDKKYARIHLALVQKIGNKKLTVQPTDGRKYSGVPKYIYPFNVLKVGKIVNGNTIHQVTLNGIDIEIDINEEILR